MMDTSRFVPVGAAVGGLLIFGVLAACSGSQDPTIVVEEEEPNTETKVLMDDTVELADGYSDPVEIDVPEDVYSIGVSVIGSIDHHNYLITDWQSPEGFQLVPDGWEDSDGRVCYPGCANRIMMAPGGFGGIAPNNPDAEPGVEPGTHEFVVHSTGSGLFTRDSSIAQQGESARVLVHAEIVREDIPESGQLDLNLFFTGSHGWTADTAPDDEELQAHLDQIDTLFDQVDIDLGEIAYHDVEGNYDIIEDLHTGSGDLAELFAQSERAELDGPSVFFVEDLQSPMDDGGAGGVLGISGGIPGPMLVDGSPRSGVAVGTNSSSGFGAPGIANVTAHELGHYLGLYHTTEQGGRWSSGPSHDPLPDTDTNDRSYLMHATGSGTEISEWQGRVMRKNPWVELDDDEQ